MSAVPANWHIVNYREHQLQVYTCGLRYLISSFMTAWRKYFALKTNKFSLEFDKSTTKLTKFTENAYIIRKVRAEHSYLPCGRNNQHCPIEAMEYQLGGSIRRHQHHKEFGGPTASQTFGKYESITIKMNTDMCTNDARSTSWCVAFKCVMNLYVCMYVCNMPIY